jgi:hypothetical protein
MNDKDLPFPFQERVCLAAHAYEAHDMTGEQAKLEQVDR